MILNNAIALNLHIPHGYPMSAGNKKACKDYFPNVNFKLNDPKNCEIFISGNCYVVDFYERIQYPKNGRGKARLVKRSSDWDHDFIKVRGTAGVKQTF